MPDQNRDDTPQTLGDFAAIVLDDMPDATKDECGAALARLVGDLYGAERWQHEAHARYIRSLGAVVSALSARTKDAEKRERLALATENGIAYNGRPITETLSVRRDDGSRQLVLWTQATPSQFVEAVLREEAVAAGRVRSNRVRMQLASIIADDEHLMALPTLAAVCEREGINPDSLGLDELSA